MKLINTDTYLLLIDEEAEIKKNDLVWHPLLKGGSIINSFWDNPNSTCIKIIAYYPLTSEAKELDLPLLPNPNIKGDIDIEELACNIYGLSLDEYEYIKEDLSQNRELIEEHYRDIGREEISKKYFDVISFICGYQAAQSKQFSLEDIKKAFQAGSDFGSAPFSSQGKKLITEEEYIQSLSNQKLPSEFIPEYEEIPSNLLGVSNHRVWRLKTITNSQGQKIVLGEYKFE